MLDANADDDALLGVMDEEPINVAIVLDTLYRRTQQTSRLRVLARAIIERHPDEEDYQLQVSCFMNKLAEHMARGILADFLDKINQAAATPRPPMTGNN